MTTVFISCATSNTGVATIQALSKMPGVKIVAQVRNPTKAAEKLKGLNVTIVQGEVEVKEGNVPHHSMMKISQDMKASGATSLLIIPPVEHRVTISAALANAAKHAGITFIALISVTGTMTGPNSGLFATQFCEIELEVAKTKIPSCFLRCPFFMENHWGNVGSIKGQGAFYFPVKPDTKYPQICVADIGECAAVVLANPVPHRNRNYHLSAETTTMSATAAAYSKVLGKPCNGFQATNEQAVQAMSAFMPKWQSEGVVELWNGLDAGIAVVGSKDVTTLLGHDGKTFEQWLTPIAGAFK